MSTIDELRAKAARALRLADDLTDEKAAEALRELAAEYLEQVAELERSQGPRQ